MTRERYDQDLQMARAAHMNLLRVHAHVDHPAFYEAADAAGILVWQDFPLQWLYRREVLQTAREQARQMARMLYNHPALVIWCMHNEALYVTDTTADSLLTQARVYISVLFWNWNRDVLDRQIKRDVEEQDPTRSVVRSSGEFSIPFLRNGTDSHFYMGWYTRAFGPLRTWERLAHHLPNNIRFVSEFGAQSFPNLESCLKFMHEDPQKTDWELMRERHQFQPSILEYSLPWRGDPQARRADPADPELPDRDQPLLYRPAALQQIPADRRDRAVYVPRPQPGDQLFDRRLLAPAQAIVCCDAAGL